jgi:hypothetical protein
VTRKELTKFTLPDESGRIGTGKQSCEVLDGVEKALKETGGYGWCDEVWMRQRACSTARRLLIGALRDPMLKW